MANFARIRLAGFWTQNSVWDPQEAEDADSIRPKLANFTDGSTHAPSGFITVGGSGFEFTGTGHSLAAAGRLTVQSSGEIRVASGGFIVVKSGGELTVEGGGNLEVQATGTIDVLNLASLLVRGTLRLEATSGPGILVAETGSASTWQSGSSATWDSGSTCTLSGTTDVHGAFTIKGSGGTGSFTAEAATVCTFNGNSAYAATATETWTEGATVNGVVTRQGLEIRSGTSARTARRAASTLANADADATVQYDRYNVPLIITASRSYTVRHTGTVPRTGERILFSRTGTTTPSALFSASIIREDTTVIFLFGAERQGFCEVEWDGSNWVLIAGVSVASGTSGYYNDVW